MERTATMGSRGTPPMRTFAGEFLYRSGRRNGKARAAALTQRMVTTPASTPIESSVANELERTDHARMPATMMEATMMAGMGAWVRSLTSESLPGRMRSNDQAKMVRTGMKVLGNMAGRFQNTKLMAMSRAKKPLLAAILAIRL